jgi:hypothetical protein
MNTDPRQPQNAPSYSPRQMSQGNNSTQAQREAAPARETYQAAQAQEEDARESSACLGED